MSQPKVLSFEVQDRYGDSRIIHKTRHGLQLKRQRSTVPLTLTNLIGPIVGSKIKQERIKKGWTLERLCKQAGIVSSTPKSRMYEIESGSRKDGIRFGTLYAIAIALGVAVDTLLPTTQEVVSISGVRFGRGEQTLKID